MVIAIRQGLTADQITVGCLLQPAHGLHSSQHVKVTKVGLQYIEFVPVKTGSSTYQRPHRKDMNWVLAHYVLLERERDVRAPAAPTSQPADPIAYFTPEPQPVEEATVPQVHHTVLEMTTALTQRRITAEVLAKGIRAFGMGGVEKKLGLTSTSLLKICQMWGVETPGKGNRTHAYIDEDTARLFEGKLVYPEREHTARPASNGNGHSSNGHAPGPVTLIRPSIAHPATPYTPPRPAPTNGAVQGRNPIRDAIRHMAEQRAMLKHEEEQLRTQLAQKMREVQAIEAGIEAMRATNLPGTSATDLLRELEEELTRPNG